MKANISCQPQQITKLYIIFSGFVVDIPIWVNPCFDPNPWVFLPSLKKQILFIFIKKKGKENLNWDFGYGLRGLFFLLQL